MGEWQTRLRSEGKSEATIATYTRHLKAVLRWAHSQGLLAMVPKLAMPKRAKGQKEMKGRPITGEEFDRMLDAVPKVVGTEDAESWRHFLHCLWWSGLRLGESLTLAWVATLDAIVVDLSGRRPMLRIPAEAKKANRDTLLPIASEFAEFLLQTPPEERSGRVFRPRGRRFGDGRVQADWVSRVVCRIGKAARVVVDERERLLKVDARAAKAKPARKAKSRPAADGMKVKDASAHDLRRAFGLRWSARVMPAVLQQLMRHESIETMMKYYVGRDADSVADALWAAVKVTSNGKSTISGNIAPSAEFAGAK